MKLRNLLCTVYILGSFGLFAQSKSAPEVFIMGTMHDVPKIVKHSYKPLLKKAIAYQPDAIYVERSRPEDSLSLKNYESRWFLPLGDSLAQTFAEDPSRTLRLKETSISEMEADDFEYLKHYYAVHRDKANWHYYAMLHTYGLKGSKKPTRHENGDLTMKLGVAMDMNYIYAMDHQHETQLYTKLAKECRQASRQDGQIELLIKNNRREYNRAILPALFRGLGNYSNKVKTIKMYEVANKFLFRTTPCEPCTLGGEVWDRRNAGMAYNIGSQVLEHGHQKAIVIVGAGHVLGIRAELLKQFPDLKVTIMDEKGLEKH